MIELTEHVWLISIAIIWLVVGVGSYLWYEVIKYIRHPYLKSRRGEGLIALTPKQTAVVHALWPIAMVGIWLILACVCVACIIEKVISFFKEKKKMNKTFLIEGINILSKTIQAGLDDPSKRPDFVPFTEYRMMIIKTTRQCGATTTARELAAEMENVYYVIISPWDSIDPTVARHVDLGDKDDEAMIKHALDAIAGFDPNKPIILIVDEYAYDKDDVKINLILDRLVKPYPQVGLLALQ